MPVKMLPLWLDPRGLPRFPSLKTDLVVDAVVIGGGITGITSAYLLKQSGLRVALIERERCGGVDTSYTTAHLTCVTDKRLHELVATLGEDKAKAVWDSGYAAIDQIVKNIEAEEIDCDFKWVPGYLFSPIDGKQFDLATLKSDAIWAQQFGLSAKYLGSIPYFDCPGVKFDHQAIFHPLKYLRGLLNTIPGKGSYVFEASEATEFSDKPLSVKVRDCKIYCKYMVMATHTPLTGQSSIFSAMLLQTKLSLYTSYVLGAKLPPNLVPQGSFWDTEKPYHYLRVDLRRGFDYVIFGGEDHKTGQQADTHEPYERLERTLKKWLPHATVDRRWSGQVVETNDGLPYIGKTSENQFIATGFAGNGMTFGTLAAMMAVDAFHHRANPWADLYVPDRKRIVGGTWNYLKENKDYPYYLLRDWMAKAEGKSLQAVRRGQGKILNLQGKKVAAYRDDDGKVTLCSPVCTHLKCVVVWNSAERTWDCPCHGSRFKATGEVMAGPAEQDLERIEQ